VTGAREEILILNKTDIGEHASWREAEAVRVSCLTNEGFDRLSDLIFARVMGGGVASRDASVAINARHQACLENARGFCEAARVAIDARLSAEYIAVELRAALDAVGEVVGKADTEELLGKIFSTFCIGK
ncbi:MAG: tRNA uridine-5-carboxymethylaminomethyl(34) synthesis GTPase MnmE, partial [Verrucomicrobiota bacterium]